MCKGSCPSCFGYQFGKGNNTTIYWENKNFKATNPKYSFYAIIWKWNEDNFSSYLKCVGTDYLEFNFLLFIDTINCDVWYYLLYLYTVFLYNTKHLFTCHRWERGLLELKNYFKKKEITGQDNERYVSAGIKKRLLDTRTLFWPLNSLSLPWQITTSCLLLIFAMKGSTLPSPATTPGTAPQIPPDFTSPLFPSLPNCTPAVTSEIINRMELGTCRLRQHEPGMF